MFSELPTAVQEEISINDIYPTLIQVYTTNPACIHIRTSTGPDTRVYGLQ